MRRLLRDQGEAGGEGAGAGTGTTKPDVNAGADKGGKHTDGEAGGGTQGKLTPEKQIEELTKNLAEATGKYDGIAKKLGEQSKYVDMFNKMSTAMKDRPIELARKLLKDAGIEADFTKKNTDAFIKAYGDEGTVEEKQAALDGRLKDATEEIRAEVRGVLGPILEQQLAVKYPDWDQLSEPRSQLESAVKTGTITGAEYAHLAARGFNVKAAMEEYAEKKVQEKLEELGKKSQKGAGGSSPTDKGAAAGESASVEEVVKQMNAYFV